MTRILVTGARWFVGPYLVDALRRSYESNIEIIATAKHAGHHTLLGPVKGLDVTDRAAVEDAIAGTSPTHIVHLAGIAASIRLRPFNHTDPGQSEALWFQHLPCKSFGSRLGSRRRSFASPILKRSGIFSTYETLPAPTHWL
jgi:hypothetical protein